MTRLLDVQRIWDRASHNAFTGLVRHGDRWLCCFREATDHISPDGILRVITSDDGQSWESVAVLASSFGDCRDPKLCHAPDGRLMLNCGVWNPPNDAMISLAWFSADGADWGEPVQIGEPDSWLWRIAWHRGRAYCMAVRCLEKGPNRLYASDDGVRFTTLVDKPFPRDYPNENTIVFADDDTAVCLLRHHDAAGPADAQVGVARPPYTEWAWRSLGVPIGGPHMIRLPDGRLLAAVRLWHPGGTWNDQHTALCLLDLERPRLEEVLALPSHGDSSYAGMVLHEGLLWVSYYSSHEGRTSIYLARVALG